MSPKRALAKVRAKAKAKVAARGGVRLRRPAGVRAAGVLRRPGAQEDPGGREEVKTPVENFKEGKPADLHQVPLEEFKVGALLVVIEGTYFDGPCRVAGRVREAKMVEDGRQVTIEMTGTTNEEMLKYGTGAQEKHIRAHLCSPTCPGEPHTPGKIHAKKGYLVPGHLEGGLTWEKNLLAEPVDELAQLRALQGAHATPVEKDKGEGAKKAKKAKSSSSSTSGQKKKSRKKKKKKKVKEKEEKKRSMSPEGASGGDQKGKKKKKRTREYGGRSVAKKELLAIYEGTGMDPRSRIR